MREFASSVFSSLPLRDMATILSLSGDLGSGKTAFVKQLGKVVGVKEEILSPTFVIMKLYDISYKNFKKLIHIDAYRIEDSRELEVLNWHEIASDKNNLIAIEWPEKVKQLIPSNSPKIKFEFVDENTRRITIDLGFKIHDS